jgi:NAD(P)-dependent dehydrogenase (short-subunit alcohol dehydrogenase family)
MAEKTFEGQVAIVTGAASGIGRAIAQRLAAGGAAVAVIDQDLPGAIATVQGIEQAGGRAVALKADVARAEDVREAVARTRAELGTPSILVNNAGITRGGRISDITEADWDLVLAVNLRSCYLFCKEVVPLMVEQRYGRIISISSGTGVRVGPGTGPYAASKAGVIALMKSVAGEVATRNITANVVAPGLTDTAMTRGQFGDEQSLQEAASTGRIANPMRAVIQPEDIAAAVAFFASPESRYITGQTLHVNAGSFMP